MKLKTMDVVATTLINQNTLRNMLQTVQSHPPRSHPGRPRSDPGPPLNRLLRTAV